MNNFDREIADLSAEKRELLEALLEEGDGLNLLPLSFAQQRLWFLDQLEPGSAFYNMAVAVRLTGTLDAEALRASLNEVVRRHESLRTRFSVVGEQPVQLISPALQIDLPPVEVPGGTPEEREAEVRRLAAEEARRPFDLSQGPLLRALLLRLSAGEHVILLTMHHIVSDGWSLGVLVREVAALYEAGVGGESSPLQELPIQYADFAVWQREWLRGEVLDEQLGYWKQQLGGATSSLELPTDRPRSAAQIARGGAVPVSLPAQLTDALKALSLQEGATLFMTLLAAWQTLLRRYANEDDVIVGSPVANRNREEIEDLIGFFVNTLALRTDMSGDPTFREVLRRVRRVTLEAYAHQDIPFEKLVEELQPERSLGRNPFFQVLFALQNAPMGALELPGLTLKLEEFESGTTRFELEFHLREHDGGMRGELLYSSDLYDAATAERMVEHFRMLLEGVVRDPDENVSALPLLAEAEEQQLLVEWNRTATPYRRELCVHEMFARQAERAPDEIAILFDGTEVSYGELNRRANRLARHLQKSGVGPESVVGICFERSIEMLVSVLGVLKAGGAYLPLDPEYPQARLAFMLADSRARVLLTQSSLSGRVPAGEANVIRLDAEWAEVEKESGENPESLATPGNLAYVLYTSGSTGKPKGVAMPHRPLVNLVNWQRERSAQSNPPRTLQFTSLSFDVSFQEIFATWCVGATLVLIREEVRRDARALLHVLEDARIERLFLPFVALQYLAEVSEGEGFVPSNLREVITAGEQLKITRHLRGMFRKMTACTLDNQYGPSEAHVVSSFMLDGRPENWPEVPPIGRPIANAQLYILDEHLRPVPVGVAGELYIGGDCLARGYVGHEETSAEKFVPNPFGSDSTAARLYRTGDRARFLRGGDIEFLGRYDRQLKVRGYRVELGEIESALRQHAEVREAVVVAVEDAAGEKRLAAYVLKDEQAGATAHELRGHLRERLPEYMVPSVFMLLDEFPLTPSGKVDRRALPTPDLSQMGLDGREDSYVAPRTPVEEMLAGIWSEVLGAKLVGVRDNFFESGGHSLLATRLMSRLREAFRVEIPLRSLFEHPTVEGLAQVIKAQGSEAAAFGVTPARRASDDGPLPLSFAQQRLWFIDQLNPGSTLYSLPGALRLEGALDVAALQRSIDEVVRRHEAMRTSFATVEGEPVQVVHPFQPAGLPVVDLRHLPQAERQAEASRLATEESRKPFDLKQWPLIRTALLRLAEDEHVLLFTVHHIIADGWSVAVLVREVAAFYGDFIAGRQPSLPELPIQYGDYALWQRERLRGEVLEEQLGYWKRQLSGASPVLELPTDRPRPAIQSWDGAKQRVVITAALNERLKKLAQREGVTLYMLMLAAFQTLLYRYTRQTDINVGSPIAGRNQLETEGLIGLFINVLIMRAELDGEMSFRELLHRVRQTALEAYARQDLPFEKLVDELHPGRDLSHTPLFQVMFVLQNAPQETPELPGLSLSVIDTDNGTSRFDLTLELTERGPELEGFFEYKTELFDASTIARLGEHLLTLLEGIAAEPSQTLSELPLLSADERELILRQWNDTAAAYPADKCVHQLFEEQAARTPDSTAVIFEETQLSYAELNRRANCLAHHLRTLGVKPGARVGICVERGAEMVVGLLGILKAGAAYVPLDPSYPRERLAFMIEDARLSVLLTQESLLDELPPHDVRVLCLDADWSDIARQSEANPLAGATPDSLAYVIYTSGSTGRPKGVMVAHRNVANFFAAMDDRVGGGVSGSGGDGGGVSPGVWLAVTSISFDISVLELLWTLARGFRVVVQPDAARDESSAWSPAAAPPSSRPMDFSLFYFASSESADCADKYRLLMDGARFADAHGFAAVWTPERHFHDFGGLYPNPAVVGAAVAAVTRNVSIRAGSVVLPLHHPARVAEEWAVVDNLSGGRVGVSFASGWHADDFVFAPERYARRQELMYEQIEVVRRLWRGEAASYVGGAGNEVEVRTLPRPVQAELPVWVTAAGSVETFRSAGRIGAGLLTHLLGQSTEDLATKIEAYREAWREAGHAGAGHVTLMLHTFVGEDADEVREKVRQPFTNYLKSSIGLIKNLAKSFGYDMSSAGFTQDDMDALLGHAFSRYFETSGLFGTPQSCLTMVERLKSIGVDEIACLIDFGVDSESVLAGLELLNELRGLSNEKRAAAGADYSLATQMQRHGVTHFQCTPSLANVLSADARSLAALSSLRKLMLGGEALPLSLAQRLLGVTPARLHNMYGPTETTIWSTTQQVGPDADRITIGSPVANTQTYVLNKRLELQPFGVAGELYIGGTGVVRGYLNRPELTAERFIADPFSTQPGGRMYRTGDMARVLPDGTIEFLGRADHQVKVRGHRIELGEIETALEQHPAAREAVVVASDDERGEKRLVAYVVADEHQPVPTTSEWRHHLQQKLPDYMIPSVFVLLERLPLTPNGKVDRRALPAPDEQRPRLAAAYVAPRTPEQELLAEIWRELLGIERVGVHDNFFELGGHSLLATQLVSRVREVFAIEMPLRSLFESPTVAELASEIERRSNDGEKVRAAPPVRAVSREEELPLSFAQQRLWFLQQLEPDNAFYNVPVAVRLTGRLNLGALEKTLGEIKSRHEILRTTFGSVEGRAVQVIAAPEELRLPVVELRHLPREEREAEALRFAAEQAQRPFDLARGPLLRPQVLRLDEEEHVVLLTMHHIVSDAWSTNLLIGEVGTLYRAFAAGEPSPLPELTIQYADFAVWQREWLRGEVLDRQLSYWREQLRGLPTLELPSDHPRPSGQSYRGAHQDFVLDERVTAGLMELSRQQGATLFMTLLAAWQTLLARYSGQDDVVVGTPIAGRNRAETEQLIGFFINALVLRSDLSGDPTFAELVRRVREICLGAYAHQDVPFEKLVEELQPERGLSRHPLFQVSFNLQNAPLEVLELPGLSISKFSDGSEATQFDLSLEIREVEGGLRGLIQYNTDIFEADTIERVTAHFKTLLTAVAGAPEQRLSQLPILTTDERRQLLVEWNDTPRELSIRQCIHQAFEAQAERTPDSAAVVFNDERLSYRELNERADRLARQLLDRGVEPETRIGLCVRRSAEMIVALLGILKAGGTYVPLDPSYPRERLAFMIEDARVSVLLTETAVIDALPLEHRARVVLLDVGPDADAVLSTENPARALRPGNLAYVIYTSGSTGTPKGIGVTHEVAVNHISAIRERFGIEADDRVLQFASLSFDVSVEQILTALLTGATSVLRGDELWSAADFTEQLEAQALTVVNFPTAYWHQLARECVTGGSLTSRHGLKLVIIGGDTILPEAVRAWQSTPMNGVRLLNAYGPTETAITASTFDVPAGLYDGEEKSLRRVPIGRPVNLRAVYVLDKHGNLSPVGVPGELYIGGPLLARGYLNKPDLTAERFVPDPFGTRPGARMYRTGDLVRRMRDGQLEFLGRVDNQVKVRGFRIELGEIEAVLGRHEGVFEAVVEARREDAAGEKQLVAYLVPREADAFALEDVRSYLQEKLPAYMQPSAFVLLERLPLTPNGKVDRRALPAPDFNRAAPEREEATPRTHAEQTLSDIWREVLRLERVGVHDNFFEVGGDSILSLQIIAKAQGAGLRLTPKQIFDRPTVAELAAVAGEVALAEQDAVRGEVPLTPIQRRFFEQNPDRPNHFNQSILLETRQPVEPALMERAVRHLHLHHDALRLRFTRGDGWRQFNHGVEAAQADFTRVDFSHLTEDELKSAIETEAENVQRSLDVESGPLVRVVLFDLGAGRPGRLLLVIHHLVVDGVSWRILVEDLQRLYAQLSRGERLELAPKTASFKNWAERLSQYARTASQKEELAYWLASSRQETGRLPVEIEEGPNTEASAQTVTWALGEDETRALLQEVPRAYRTQINDVLLAALAQTLAVCTGGRRVLVDLEGHGREEIFENVDLSRTVGWFTSIFPVLLDAGNDPQPGDLLKSIKEQLRAIPQRGIGYGLLRYLSGDAEAAMKLRALPQAEVVFNYLGQFDQTLGETSMFGFAAESGGRERRGDAPRGHLLEINASVAAGQLRVNWTYGEQVFRRETVTQLAADFGSALRALVAHCLSAEAGGLTPSDFPLAKLEQRTLDRLLETQTAVEDIYRLSPTQDGILFHTLFAPEANEYHGQLAWTLGGVVDVAALERAWRQVLERHPALRTSFVWHGVEQPLQIVHKGVGLPVEQLDWRPLSTPEQEARFESFLGEDRARGLELTEAPLMRLTLVRLTDESYRFVWSHHHLLLDGWSRSAVLKEVLMTYAALVRGEQPELERARPYRDFVGWLGRQDISKAEAYWREYLSGFSAPTPFGVDRARRAAAGATARHDERLALLPESATRALRQFARQHRLTLNTLVQGAWAILLSRYSREADVVFGATVAGRPADLTGDGEMVGLFINTLPVRARVEPETPLLGWLKNLQEQQAEAREFEYTPLVEVQRWSEVAAGAGLFESIVVFENYPVDEMLREQPDGLKVSDVRSLERTSYPLTLGVVPGEDELSLHAAFDGQRFDGATVERMLGHLRMLLEGFVINPAQRISQLSLLTEVERHHLTVEWNDTRADFPHDRCLHELFEAQAAETPRATALAFEDRRLSYEELNARANQLAHHLRQLKVGPEVRVGVLLERSPESVTALLGVLKAGGVYVPLDPSHPRDRLAFIADDVRLAVLVTTESLLDRLPDGVPQVVRLDSDRAAVEAQSTQNPEGSAAPGDTAYMIYTSGSTGRPKGVMVEHRNLVNTIATNGRKFDFNAADSMPVIAPFVFDISLFELLTPLTSGATAVLLSKEHVLDLPRLAASLTGVTLLHLVPSLMRQVVDYIRETDRAGDYRGLRSIFVGGELVPTALLKDMQEVFPSAQIHVLYGPTEATIICTSHAVADTPVDGRHVIGTPLANARVRILDSHLNVVPVGVTGEIFVAGAGVARGYWNRAELNAEKFVRVDETRYYRTGDLARYLPNGEIEFLGRDDEQVKIRGHRIEIGEIESAMRRHPAVRETAVMAREDVPGDRRLVAYVVTGGGAETPPAELRTHLQQALPEYMIPSAFVTLDEMPLTPNGKVDRRALPAPDAVRPESGADYVAPRTPVEEVLAGIWRRLLGVARVGLNDNFFELGGHSLLATQLVSRVREAFEVELPLRRFYANPTLNGIAEIVEEARRTGETMRVPPITSRPREGDLPLSFAQQRLWFLAQMQPDSPFYNIPLAVSLKGRLDVSALEQTLNEIIRRHEVLRTVFHAKEGQPAQVVLPSLTLSLPLTFIESPSEEGRAAEAERLAADEARRPFDLERGPLVRATLLRLEEEEHVLLLSMHHIVSDGWSMGVFVKEVVALYEAFSAGEASPLDDLRVQYADFAVWQREWLRGEVRQEQLAYWKQTLQGAPPVLELPTDRPRPAIQTYSGAYEPVRIPAELSAELKALGEREGVTLFMTLLAAFQTLLSYYARQNEFSVGTDIAGRNRAETEHLIGFFINQLVLRADVSGDPTFRELLKDVRETALGAYTHQDTPFEMLVEALKPERSLKHSPLFQAKFVLQNLPHETLRAHGLTVRPLKVDYVASKFDLTLLLEETPDGIAGDFEYNTDLFEAATMRRMAKLLTALLQSAVTRPDARVEELKKELAALEKKERGAEQAERREASRRKLMSVNAKAVGSTPVAVDGPYGD